MRGRKIIGLLLSAVTLIFIIACLLFYHANQAYQAEKGIEEAIKAYSAVMEEAEIKVLTSEVNEAVEKKFSEMNTGTLSNEDLEELLETAVKELENGTLKYRDTDITQEEVYHIASEVIKKAIEQKITPVSDEQLARLEAYRQQLDSLIQMQYNYDTQIARTHDRIGDLSKEISDAKKTMSADLKKEYDELEADLISQSEKLNQLENDAGSGISDLIGKLEKLENELNEQLKKLKTDSGTELGKLESDLNTQLEKLKIDLSTQLEKLETDLNAQLEVLNQLREKALLYEYDQATQTLKLTGKQ